MVPLTDLWLPILLSAVAVFLASNVMHLVLPHHRSDYGPLPKEAEVMDALRRFAIPPGDYMMPRAADMAEMKSPAFKEKWKRGPVASMTFMPSDHNFMGVTLDVLEGKRPQVPADCPADYAEIMTRCWSGKPKKRPTMEAVVQFLNSCIGTNDV